MAHRAAAGSTALTKISRVIVAVGIAALAACAGADKGTLSPFEGSSMKNPAVAVLRDGGFLAVYASSRTLSPLEPWRVSSGIYSRRFDAGGVPTGTETLVVSFVQDRRGARSRHFVADPSVLAWDDGQHLVGWADVEESYTGTVPQFRTQRFDSKGQPSGGQRVVGRGDVNTSYKLMAMADGGYVVSTFHRHLGLSYVSFGIHDATGAGASIGPLYNAEAGLAAGDTTLAPLGDGSLALWSKNKGGAYRQLFDRSGNALGPATPVAAQQPR